MPGRGSRQSVNEAWQRLGVFFELRDDAGSEARKRAERSQPWPVRIAKLVLAFVLVVAVGTLFFSVVALVVHLVGGGDTSPHGVLVSGLRLFAVAWVIAMLVFFVGRWVYWLADRWAGRARP
jgi:hypothetical protein